MMFSSNSNAFFSEFFAEQKVPKKRNINLLQHYKSI